MPGTSATLVCPATRLPVEEVPLDEARRRINGGQPLLGRAAPTTPAPIGETPTVMLRSDDRAAYPVIDGIPMLLAPERLTAEADRITVDLTLPAYAEAYSEMGVYNQAGLDNLEAIEGSELYEIVRRPIGASTEEFPEPFDTWLDAAYDCTAQEDCYRLIAPHVGPGSIVGQVGGSGSHAVKLLLAGASQSWLITPMVQEAAVARALAEVAGVSEGLRVVVCVAEELPFAAATFDALLSGGCLHHIETSLFGPELTRVLVPGGVFAAYDPWRSPLFKVGTTVFGRREKNVYCKPLDAARVDALAASFEGSTELKMHSPLARYVLLAMFKMKMPSTLQRGRKVLGAEQRFVARFPKLHKLSSSAAVLLERRA